MGLQAVLPLDRIVGSFPTTCEQDGGREPPTSFMGTDTEVDGLRLPIGEEEMVADWF